MDEKTKSEWLNTDNKCPNCGLPFFDDKKSTSPAMLCKCSYKEPSQPGGMQGWICPNCGAGMSPYTTRCGCKDFFNYGYNNPTFGIAGSPSEIKLGPGVNPEDYHLRYPLTHTEAFISPPAFPKDHFTVGEKYQLGIYIGLTEDGMRHVFDSGQRGGTNNDEIVANYEMVSFEMPG